MSNERLNWSSLVRSIDNGRSGKALFFKPVLVIAAIDLADEMRLNAEKMDAPAILDRFSDYVTPFFRDRGGDGHQPLWHLSNNHLWSFYKAGRSLDAKTFASGKPGTRKRLLSAFDRMAINEAFTSLWASKTERRALRDQMLLMLQESDGDSRLLVPTLFDPRRDQPPSQDEINAYLAPLRAPSLFDHTELAMPPREADASAGEPERTPSRLRPVDDVPSAIEYIWSFDRIVVGPNSASLPLFPFVSAERDYESRREAALFFADRILSDLVAQHWQVREDYRAWVEVYLEHLPRERGSGNVLLADSAIRTLRSMFAAEKMILSPPFAASLKTLLELHAALRPFFPEIESFYRAVRSGRLEEALPLDAVEDLTALVREHTPAVFDESVSSAIVDAAAPEPRIEPVEAPAVADGEVISPPPDPLGDLEPGKAHDLQTAGVFNRLWKVFNAVGKIRSNTEAWIKTYDDLAEPMGRLLDWLRHIQN